MQLRIKSNITIEQLESIGIDDLELIGKIGTKIKTYSDGFIAISFDPIKETIAILKDRVKPFIYDIPRHWLEEVAH